MKYREAVKIAIRALKVNKTRASLTILGIVIGIAAVIVVMSAGDSIRQFVFAEMDSFGSDIIETEVKVPSTQQMSSENATAMVQGVVITTLTLDDKKAIDKLPNIKQSYAAFLGQEVVHWQENVKNSLIMGTTAEIIEIDSSKMDEGRFFTEEEDDSLARVAVIGSKVKESLFADSEALEQNIKIRKMNFRVIGVLESQGASVFFDRDGAVFIPLQTGQKLLWGVDYINFMASEMIDTAKEQETIADMTYLIRERHDITDPDKDDFAIMSMEDAKEMLGTIIGAISLLLVALAGISLVVGGVGIMNIMYVSVTERTFEIGLRKSFGAKKKDIMEQFLTEAVVITFLGGIAGIILGIFLNYLIFVIAQAKGFSWSWSLPLNALLTSLIFAVVVGLVFGLYPAKRAAELSPIDALRQD